MDSSPFVMDWFMPKVFKAVDDSLNVSILNVFCYVYYKVFTISAHKLLFEQRAYTCDSQNGDKVHYQLLHLDKNYSLRW